MTNATTEVKRVFLEAHLGATRPLAGCFARVAISRGAFFIGFPLVMAFLTGNLGLFFMNVVGKRHRRFPLLTAFEHDIFGWRFFRGDRKTSDQAEG